MKKILRRMSMLALLAIPLVTLSSCGFEEGAPFEKKNIDLTNLVFKDSVEKFTNQTINFYPQYAVNGNSQTLRADLIPGLVGIDFSIYMDNEKVAEMKTQGEYECVLKFEVNETLYNPVEEKRVTVKVCKDVDLNGIKLEDGSASIESGKVADAVLVKDKDGKIINSSNLPEGVKSVSYLYEGTNGTSYESSNSVPKAVGEYTVTPQFEYKTGYYEFDSADAELEAKLTVQTDIDMSGVVTKDIIAKAGNSVAFAATGLPSGVSATYKVNGVTKENPTFNEAGAYKIVTSFTSTTPFAAPIQDRVSWAYIYDNDNKLDPTLFEKEYDDVDKDGKPDDIALEKIEIGNFTLNNIELFKLTSQKSSEDNVTFLKDKSYVKLSNTGSIKVTTNADAKKIVMYISSASSKITSENNEIKINNNVVKVESTTVGASGSIVKLEYDASTQGVYEIKVDNTYKIYSIEITD